MNTAASLPDHLAQRLLAIQKLIAEGHLPEAGTQLNAAMRDAPGDARIFLMGSRLSEAAGNAEGALDAARRAVNLTPEWPVAVTELAFLLARQNKLREAVATAERAVALGGNDPQVLAHAIDIAHRAQHFDLAIAWLQRAILISPADANMKRLLARDLRVSGQHDKAIAAYNELLEASPTDALALMGRAQTQLATGNNALALKDCEVLHGMLPDDEEVQFYLELARGNTPPRQPAAMVRSLYDGFASLYDQHIVAALKYKLPREVARKIAGWFPDLKLNLLDLGCGTGLLGACLGRVQGAMVGVELSTPMVEQAARHGVYDRFHTVDLHDALAETPSTLYDVIAALDVFIYAGDLRKAIPDAWRILRPGGYFIFSCESAAEDGADLVLQRSQRYAHKTSHVEELCRQAGFEPVTVETVALRYEGVDQIDGVLVTARKPG